MASLPTFIAGISILAANASRRSPAVGLTRTAEAASAGSDDAQFRDCFLRNEPTSTLKIKGFQP
jgi:hypothetical protein